MSTAARVTPEEYEFIAEKGVFDRDMPKRHIELVRGELWEYGKPAKMTLEEYERMVELGVFDLRNALEFVRGELCEIGPESAAF